jgi:hypothetical protein
VFQQDSANTNITGNALMALEGITGDRIISMVYSQHICLILSHATSIYGVIERTKYREQIAIPKKG